MVKSDVFGGRKWKTFNFTQKNQNLDFWKRNFRPLQNDHLTTSARFIQFEFFEQLSGFSYLIYPIFKEIGTKFLNSYTWFCGKMPGETTAYFFIILNFIFQPVIEYKFLKKICCRKPIWKKLTNMAKKNQIRTSQGQRASVRHWHALRREWNAYKKKKSSRMDISNLRVVWGTFVS